ICRDLLGESSRLIEKCSRIRPQAKTRPSPARGRVSAYATYSTGFKSVGVNLTLYQTTIEDHQTVVFGNTFSNPRGYLANAEEVRVRGFELDANSNIGDALSLRAALVYADGRRVRVLPQRAAAARADRRPSVRRRLRRQIARAFEVVG